MKLLERIRGVFDAVMPWPAKAERKAAIRAARAEKEKSQRLAEHARVVEAQFQRIVEENHFAESIARQIMRRQDHA